MPTIREWRIRLRQELRSIAGEFAPTDTDAILGEVVKANPTQLTLRHNEDILPDQESRLKSLLIERLSGVPLGYVLGHVEFYGLDLICDERVLIPRPETEELVSVAIRTLPAPQDRRHPLVIDVGTGSGNIALAIAHERSDVRVIATDLSADALAVARANRERHHLTDRIHFIRAQSLTAFPQGLDADLIVSNPPYVPEYDPEVQRSVHDFEPHLALYAGSDGTEILRDLIDHARAILRPVGGLVCEIGYNQAEQIREIVQRYPGWSAPVFHRSPAGFDRVLELHVHRIQ
jgi:release factor glutamine methyltransferase